MGRFAFLHLLIFTCCACQGQFIFTPKKPISLSQLSIDKHETIQLKDTIPFAAVRIVDSRYDTTTLGFYLNGFLALKDVSQSIALQHVMEKYYKSLCLPGKDTLLIQLERLSIQDDIVTDTGFLMTTGVVTCKRYAGSAGRYKYLGSVDTMMSETYSRVTYAAHKNGKHYNLEFWDWYLLRLFEAMILQQPPVEDNPAYDDGRYYTPEEIKAAGLQKRDKPILNAVNLKPGFYRTFSDFVNNEPGFGCEADSLNKLLRAMHYRVDDKVSKEEPDTTWWGFSDGKRLFMRDGYCFFQLERRDAAFYISPTLDARRRTVNRAGLNLLIGLATVAGGIAAKESVDFQGFSAIPRPEMPMIVLRLEQYNAVGLQLDWNTGKVTF